MSGSSIQGIVEDIAALVHSAEQGHGSVVLVVVREESPFVLAVVSQGRSTQTAAEMRLANDALRFVARIERYRGRIDDLPQPKKAFRTPVWMQGKLVGWIFGFSPQASGPLGRSEGMDRVFQVAAGLVRSTLEMERLQSSLQQNNAYFQKTIHDLKSFATGFLIASELWSKPKGGNLDQLRELAVLSHDQAKQMLVALERLAGHTFDPPIEVSPVRVKVRDVLLAACAIPKKQLPLPDSWAPTLKGGGNVSLWCEPATLGPALAGVIAVSCGFEMGGPVTIDVSQLSGKIQIVVQGRGELPVKGNAATALRDERFVPLDMVERIVTAHRGSIQVEWPKKKPCKFTLLLPSKA